MYECPVKSRTTACYARFEYHFIPIIAQKIFANLSYALSFGIVCRDNRNIPFLQIKKIMFIAVPFYSFIWIVKLACRELNFHQHTKKFFALVDIIPSAPYNSYIIIVPVG